MNPSRLEISTLHISMIRHLLTAALFSVALLSSAVALPEAEDADKERKTAPAKEDSGKPKSAPALPEGVLNFYGKVTGTVESVDAEKGSFKVKVTTAEANAEKNKAAKPESLTGMTIEVTPLAKSGEDDKVVLDPEAVAYIKGAKAGDAVTLNVRASSKGVVFRLLKVPAAATK